MHALSVAPFKANIHALNPSHALNLMIPLHYQLEKTLHLKAHVIPQLGPPGEPPLGFSVT